MNKKIFWIFAVGICLGFGIWGLGFWLVGCSAPLQEEISTTTTTTGGGTTTTTAPTSGISGTVTWTWGGSPETGTLYVALWTNGDFSNRDLLALDNDQPAVKKHTLSSGQTGASFNFTSPGGPVKGTTPTPGKYYLIGLLYVGRSAQMFDDPVTGDKVGQFSDGKLPIIFGGATNPEAINYSGTAITGKNFPLNATWAPPSTTTTTLPPDTSWQNIGDVTKSGSAENAYVNALVSDNSGNLYAGGIFDSVGGVPANNIAKWNHSTASWESLAGGLNPVNALAFISGELYAAENSQIKKWNQVTWSSLGGSFTGTMVVILALAADQNGNLYAGGSFDYAAGVPANNVAKWRTASSTWEAMAGGLIQTGWTNPTGQVLDMTSSTDGNIYLCGSFNTTESMPIEGIAKWNVSSSSWESIGGGGYAVAADSSGNIYTQGGKWNGSTWQFFTDSVEMRPPAWAIAAKSPSEVFMGSGGYGAPVETPGAVAKLNSTVWNNISGGLINAFGYADVRALAIDSAGDLYVGGKFTSAGGVPAANIVKRSNP